MALVNYITWQYAASNQSWPMSMRDQYNNAGNNYGPKALTLNYVFNANMGVINGSIVAGYGNVYFGAGNTVYALNVSTGNAIWTSGAPYNALTSYSPYINATLLYGGMLIYATAANIVALNAYNGTQVWSSYTQYASGGAPESGGKDVQMKLLQYNGRLITFTYDSTHSSSSLLYSLYANNGTLIGSSPLYANVIQYLAVSNGQIVLTTTTDKVMEVTPILSNTFDAGVIWSTSPPCSSPSYPVGVAAYSNIIVYGCGTSANVINVNSNYVYSTPSTAQVRGVSMYNGYAAVQMNGYVSLINATNQLWSQSMSAYGTPPLNATPVISSQNVYTLWSNGYLVMENLSTGSVVSTAQITYVPTGSALTNPHMALAYGRLFVSTGPYLMSFGSCPVNPNDSVLDAVGTLYVNGQSSCANYLLNSLQPLSNGNYGVTLGNSPAPQYAAQFYSAQNSYINLGQFLQEGGTNTITYTVWFNTNSLIVTYPTVFGDTLAGTRNGYDLFVGGPGSGNTNYLAGERFGGGTSVGIRSIAPLSLNTWYFAAVTYDGGNFILYLNGVKQGTSPTVLSIGVDSFMSLGAGSAAYNFGNYQIANFQYYTTALSQQQITTLYQEGIGGVPLSNKYLAGWWPLSKDSNNYVNNYFAGYPSSVTYVPVSYNQTSLMNSFSVTSASAPLPILNYSTGRYKLYNVGVYSWR